MIEWEIVSAIFGCLTFVLTLLEYLEKTKMPWLITIKERSVS